MKKLMFLLVAVFALTVVTISCKETKKESENADAQVEEAVEAVEEVVEEKMAAAVYACPMDCEEGKTYSEAGTCPECKMDLKEVQAEVEMEHAEGCKCMEAGECKCEEGKCECQKEMAAAEKECTKCEPGACQCKA